MLPDDATAMRSQNAHGTLALLPAAFALAHPGPVVPAVDQAAGLNAGQPATEAVAVAAMVMPAIARTVAPSRADTLIVEGNAEVDAGARTPVRLRIGRNRHDAERDTGCDQQ